MKNKLRITAGIYRSRYIPFPDTSNIRPTPERTREMLFNWLSTLLDWPSTHVCDLFAGSGILGFEALSRGALQATFIDIHTKTIDTLKQNALQLNCYNHIKAIRNSAEKFLSQYTETPTKSKSVFDIIFLDPPFQQDYLSKIFLKFSNTLKSMLTKKGIIYFECEQQAYNAFSITLNNLNDWRVIKFKKIGNNFCGLLRKLET